MIANPIPYPKMKDSGVPWLGEVPEHWDVLPNRVLFGEVKERDHPEEPMLSVTITKGVIRQRALLADSSKKDSSNQDKSAYKLVRLGDIAYNKMRAWQGAIGVSYYQGIVSPAYVVERPREGANSRYLHYLLRTPAFAKEAERWSYGITSDMWSLRPEHFKMIYGCLAPLPEQAAIVRFLDHADRRIRRYIRAKQKLITLLEEQKQAIIHQAVTRGLDPNVRLKPSGVEWLGEVPAHWAEAIKIKYVSSLKGRLGWQGLKAGEYTSEGPYIVSSAHFRNHKINWKICPHVTQERYEMDKHIQLAHGDILLMKDGAAMGKLAFVDELPGLACLNSHLLLFRPLADNGGIAYLPQFMFYYMQTECFQGYAQVNGTGATFLGISQESIGNHTVCLPPISEQTAVVEYLNHETADLDTTTASANRQIDLLREYHTRLIADVVTGKLDVRSAAARLPDEIKEPEPLDQADTLIDGDEEPIEDATTTGEAAV